MEGGKELRSSQRKGKSGGNSAIAVWLLRREGRAMKG